MKSKLRHVGIIIKDWQKIKPFYEALGFQLFYEAKEDWLRLTLIIRKMKNKHGDVLEFITGGQWYPHIAFTVSKLPDADGICKFNKKAQIKYVRDPEGNWIEFVKEL